MMDLAVINVLLVVLFAQTLQLAQTVCQVKCWITGELLAMIAVMNLFILSMLPLELTKQVFVHLCALLKKTIKVHIVLRLKLALIVHLYTMNK
jgi:hypothetical protein